MAFSIPVPGNQLAMLFSRRLFIVVSMLTIRIG
jgi:hypothetical protein